MGGERIAPAAMGGEGAVDGGDDFGKNVGMGLKGLVNGAVDEGPEFFFEGRVSGIGRNEDDFVILGESGEALLVMGRAAGFLAFEENGGGELDPVPVEVGNGEGFVVDVSVGFGVGVHRCLRAYCSRGR